MPSLAIFQNTDRAKRTPRREPASCSLSPSSLDGKAERHYEGLIIAVWETLGSEALQLQNTKIGVQQFAGGKKTSAHARRRAEAVHSYGTGSRAIGRHFEAPPAPAVHNVAG